MMRCTAGVCLFLLTVALMAATSAPQAAVVERRVTAGADDAEESASGSVSLSSSDLELTYDGGQQTVGVRFQGITIPRGSTVTAAWVQFQVDETDSDVTLLTVRGAASDDAAPLLATSRNLSSRTATLATAVWSPAAWNTTGEAGGEQRTPDLSAILQEIVGRPGWSGTGAVAILFAGTGQRVAVAFDGRTSAAPLLHVEYTEAAANTAPRVDAGLDRSVLLPGPLDLEGAASDDGRPASPGTLSLRWSAASGPGTVSFGDPSSATTWVSFSAAGTYVLRLTAQDGELAASDDMSVTVSEPDNRAPQGAIMSPPPGAIKVVAGTRLNFQGAAVDPDGDTPLRYAWDFGGAAPPRRVEDPGTIVLSRPGVYAVRFTVSDPDGLADPTPDVRIVTVAPAPGSRTFYVSPQGDDSADGSLLRPFRTIARAVPLLAPGDRLLLRQGVYAERPVVAASGSALAPIIMAAFPGESAVIDPALPEFRAAGNADWEPVDAALGEYRSVRTYPSGVVRGYLLDAPGYENGRVALVPYVSAEAFRSVGSDYVDSITPFYVGPGVYQEADGHIHIRLAKTPEMREAEARAGPVMAADVEDPRDHALLITLGSSALTVRGSHLVFAGLTLEPGTHTIQLSGGTHHVTFDGLTVWAGATAVHVNGPDVHDIAVVNARLYGDVPAWIAWSDAKTAPAPATLMRGTTVHLTEGARDINISYSHLRGGHDGVGMNDSEDGLVVHHCRIENFRDDAFEIEGRVRVGRVSIHENYIANSLTAVAPGQDTPVFDGPLLVYRNIIALLRPQLVNRKEGLNGWNGGGRFGFEYMFKHGSSDSYSTRNAHYYHNTLLLLGSAGKGINITPRFADDTRIANNLMMTVNGVVNREVRQAPGQVLDGDLYWKMNDVDDTPLLADEDTIDDFRNATGLEWSGLGSVPRRGTDPLLGALTLDVVDTAASVWALSRASETPGPAAFLLSAGSPAIGAGIDIPSHPWLGRLPDSRRSRDIGALPFGTGPEEFGVFPFTP